jgi:RND family efflux transporter MFP subunit
LKPLDFEPGQRTAAPPRRLARTATAVVLTALPVLLIVGGLAGYQALRNSRPVVAVTPPPAQARLIDTVTAERADWRPVLTLYGQVSAGRSVDLRALVAGEVTSVSPALVDGGLVRQGDVLLTLDPFDYEGVVIRARADLAEARSRIAEFDARIRLEREALVRAEETVAITERERVRIEGLAAKDIATVRTLEEVAVRLIGAKSAVDLRRNQMAVAEAQRAVTEAGLPRLEFALRAAERNLAQTRLVAPFDAVVSNAAAERGRLLNATDRVATLTARDRTEVRVTLSDAQYGRLVTDGTGLIGRPAEIVWRGGEVELKAHGRIDRVAPTATAAAGGFDIFVRLDTTPDAMRPGAFVDVRLADRTFAGTVRVPQSALNGDAVFIVADGRLKRVPVRVAAFDGEYVLVAGDVPAGAQVMVSRYGQAADGVPVEVRK